MALSDSPALSLVSGSKWFDDLNELNIFYVVLKMGKIVKVFRFVNILE